MTAAEIATKVAGATYRNFVTTAGLASWLKVGRDQVVEAYDVLEAAGYKLHRSRGIGGGIEVLSRPRVAKRAVPALAMAA